MTTAKDLESDFQIFHGGDLTFTNLFDETNFFGRSYNLHDLNWHFL